MRIPTQRNGHCRNIRGMIFGRLIAVHPTENRDAKGSVIWACLCDCKNIAYVSQDSLASGNTQSCGCRKKEICSIIQDQLHFVDGTCVEWIKNRKHRSDNTSGFRGVYKIRNDRYRVMIGFKGERKHVGYFTTFDEAKAARIKAEEEVYLPFLEEYYQKP